MSVSNERKKGDVQLKRATLLLDARQLYVFLRCFTGLTTNDDNFSDDITPQENELFVTHI